MAHAEVISKQRASCGSGVAACSSPVVQVGSADRGAGETPHHRWAVPRWLIVAGLMVAGWPVLRWFALRLWDGSDEPLGILPLFLAIFFASRCKWNAPLEATRCVPVAAALLGYCVAAWFGPPLVRAIAWVTVLALVVVPRAKESRSISGLAWWSLLVLSLPVIPTAQFYLGYPLRVLTTHAAAAVLRLSQVNVHADGVVLNWRSELVLIDAPCSGIQMLWTLLVLGASVACLRNLSSRDVLAMFRRAGAVVFVANTARASALFCVETRIWPDAPWMHDAIGLVVFSAAAAALFATKRAWGQEPRCDLARSEQGSAIAPGAGANHRLSRVLTFGMIGACGFAALVPLLRSSVSAAPVEPVAQFPGWEHAPVPGTAVKRQLSDDDRRFAQSFPGRIATFSDGNEIWIVRWVAQPTRKLHPGADCLRAAGFSVTPGDAFQSSTGELWSGARARRNGKSFRVKERIYDEQGDSWTDVSAWYWEAMLSRTAGPWWAVTWLTEEPGREDDR
jgi:exosortase/archaeosortase family protein